MGVVGRQLRRMSAVELGTAVTQIARRCVLSGRQNRSLAVGRYSKTADVLETNSMDVWMSTEMKWTSRREVARSPQSGWGAALFPKLDTGPNKPNQAPIGLLSPTVGAAVGLIRVFSISDSPRSVRASCKMAPPQ